jgi:hypothetical protein
MQLSSAAVPSVFCTGPVVHACTDEGERLFLEFGQNYLAEMGDHGECEIYGNIERKENENKLESWREIVSRGSTQR